MAYQVIKTYGNHEGWSCTFRQHLAKSHCRFLHGYALGVELVFECEELDDCNWCIDFGDLRAIKEQLKDLFDHKTLVAADDPQLRLFVTMAEAGLIDMIIVGAVGCEKFAEMVYTIVYLHLTDYAPRVRLVSARVFEHSGNSAVFTG